MLQPKSLRFKSSFFSLTFSFLSELVEKANFFETRLLFHLLFNLFIVFNWTGDLGVVIFQLKVEISSDKADYLAFSAGHPPLKLSRQNDYPIFLTSLRPKILKQLYC
jgi:hypothetical protein